MLPLPRILIAAGLALLVATPASAAGAPEGLRNKTVTMSWTTSGTGKRADGSTVNFNNVNTRIVYVSSEGRPFLRMQLKGNRGSREGNFAPDESRPGGGSVSFQGSRLVGTEGFASGARQYTATFDAGFSSCSLAIIDARAGSANIRRKGPDGAMYEITGVSTGSPSCSVQSGNVFAR